MKPKSRSLADSFKYAFRGLAEAVKQEPNLKIHLGISILALIGAMFFRFSFLEWAVVFLTIALVFILELINTTLETLVDIVSPEVKEKARIAKDISAAGVLLAASVSIVIVGLLYLPKIIELFF